MIDRTQPVAAPPGLKWTITRSVHVGSLWNLKLWREETRVDSSGMGWSAPLKRATQNFSKGATMPRHPLANEFIVRPTQFRRLSKRALRRGLKRMSENDLVEKYLRG